MGLPEAAAALGVHYMTAYRYVRTGRLPATLVGGVWKVDPADLAALAHPEPPAGRPSHPRGEARRLVPAMLERRLVDGDVGGAYELCERALGSWAAPADLYTEILVPTLARIGDLWEAGRLSVADEHRATATATRLMGRLGPLFVHPGRRRGQVVVGAPAGDHHAMPSAIVGDLLRHAGFGVADLGADTPSESFVAAAFGSDRLVAVAVGATLSGNEAAVEATVAAVHEALPGVPVLVGGSGIPGAEAARRTGADRWSGLSATSLVAAVEAAALDPHQRPAAGRGG
jgi:excisionase family DNA binding protein